MTDSATVLVLGAGLAGLAAAHTLAHAGVSVIVLEARDRLGGRVFTDRSWGIPLELGCTGIQGSDNNPLMPWLQQSQSSVFVLEDESHWVYNHRGRRIADRTLEDGEEVYENLLEEVTDLAEARGKDLSIFNAILELDPDSLDDPLMVYHLSTDLELELGSSIETLSARYWDTDEVFDGEDVMVRQGFDRLIASLAEGLDIRLECVVTEIHWTEAGVTIATDQGNWQGDQVICTLPLGVLKAGTVNFTPTLPKAITTAWQAVQVGHSNKVVLEFEKPFWPLEVQTFGYFAPQKGQYPYFFNLYPLHQFPGLITFALGTYGEVMETQSEQTIVAEVMDNLRGMFGRVAEPVRVQVSRWGQDPWARGSSSYIAVGAKPKDFQQMSLPVDDRLFFAGEHTNADYRGTAHGAYLSGVAAARAVLEARSEGLS